MLLSCSVVKPSSHTRVSYQNRLILAVILSQRGSDKIENLNVGKNLCVPKSTVKTTCSALNDQNTEQHLGFPESVGLRGRLLRKIEALKAAQSYLETPDEFLCPITRELMKDPVIAAG